MTANIWIYIDPGLSYLIAKRQPFHYQIYDADGSCHILQGVEIPTPVWEDIQSFEGCIYGSYRARWYDITDLNTFKNPSPP